MRVLCLFTSYDSSNTSLGSWFGPQFAGAKIPTLEEGLSLIQNLTNKAVVMDLKGTEFIYNH